MLKLLTIITMFIGLTLQVGPSNLPINESNTFVAKVEKDDVGEYIDSVTEDVKKLYSMSRQDRNKYLKDNYSNKPIKVTIIRKILNEYDKATNELNGLTSEQIKTLQANLDNKDSVGNGVLLSAIAWKESTLGINKSNPGDGKLGSYGSHQILLTTALKRDKGINKHELKKQLIADEKKSMELANEELEYWTNYYNKKDNLTEDQKIIKTIASYNAGFKADTISAGKNYVIDVVAKAVMININAVA